MLNMLFDPLQELCSRCAIDNPVIECEAQKEHLPNSDRLGFGVNDHLLGYDASNTEDRALWYVDDRRKGINVIHAQVGKAERSAAHLRSCQRSIPSAFNYSAGFAHDLP